MEWVKDNLQWVFAALAIVGTILNVYKNRVGFLFWIVSNAGWIVLAIQSKIYAQAVMFAVYLGMAAWGWTQWSKNK